MPGRHGGILSIPGFCNVCEAPTQASCPICQRPVCPDHFDEVAGTCQDCVQRYG